MAELKGYKGKIRDFLNQNQIEVGDLIKMGDPVCILEAMKMQQTIIADMSGEVMSVLVDSGDQISQGDPICTLI